MRLPTQRPTACARTATYDVSVSKDLWLGRVRMRVLAEVNNLLSQDYDVILNYPMPKRNHSLTLSLEI